MSANNPNISLREEKCFLLGGNGIFVQIFLGGLTGGVALSIVM